MRVTILGSGASMGVPGIGLGWGACNPANPRNRRRRPSILVERGAATVLVDTSPDLREQLLDAQVARLDAVLFTHAHADHLHGIDDLRGVNRAMGAPIPCWATEDTLAQIDARFGYVFKPLAEGATFFYKPSLLPRPIRGPFAVGDLDVLPFEQEHGWCKTTGFRFGPVAYSTDVVDLSPEALALLDDLEIWIVGCLQDAPHDTHAHVDKALDWIRRVKPRRAVLTHLGHKLDYDDLRRRLPNGVEPAYDGMLLEAGAVRAGARASSTSRL